MPKFLVSLLGVLFAVCLGSEQGHHDKLLAPGILECSSDRASAYLDVYVVYDRSLRKDKFGDLTKLLKKELLPLSLHGDPKQTSRVALIGFGTKVSVDLDISRVVNTQQLEQAIDAIPSKHTEPDDWTALTDALIKVIKMTRASKSTRDILVILAVSARSVDSDNAAHGTAMQLQQKGAHILTLNFDDENLLLEAYLREIADKGKAFSPYREPYFAESFTRAINYANCRCAAKEFEDGQPIQQLSIYNYTSNHVDYFANCVGAATERKGNNIREWCAAFRAQPLPTPTLSKHFSNEKLIAQQNTLNDYYHFVESFVILNNYELNSYDSWLIGEARVPVSGLRTRNSKHRALLAQSKEIALSRSSKWDYINLAQTKEFDDKPFICQKRACDALNPCDVERKSTNYYELAKMN